MSEAPVMSTDRKVQDDDVAFAAHSMPSPVSLHIPVVGGERLLGDVDLGDVAREPLTTRGGADG